MIIGFQHKRIGTYSCGIKFGLKDPDNTPYFEIFCFKLINIPSRMAFDKHRDIKGIWYIFWYQRAMKVHTKSVPIARKGFRTRARLLTGIARGTFRMW